MSFKSRNFKKTLALLLGVASIGGGAKNAAHAQKRVENSSQNQSWFAKNPGKTALVSLLSLGGLVGGGFFVKNKFFSKNANDNNNLGNNNIPNIQNIQSQITENIENKDNFQNINLENIKNNPQMIKKTVINTAPNYEKIAAEEWDKMNIDEQNDFKEKKIELKNEIQKILSPYEKFPSLNKERSAKLGKNVIMLNPNFSNNKNDAQCSAADYVFNVVFKPLFLEYNDEFEKDITTQNDIKENILRFKMKDGKIVSYRLNNKKLHFILEGENNVRYYDITVKASP